MNKDKKLISILNKFSNVKFFISNILIPLIVLAFYCGSFAYFSSQFLPEGVTFHFVDRLFIYLMLFIVGVCLTFLVIFKLNKGNSFEFKKSAEKFSYNDILLLLLPLTPVVQYILNNQDILSLTESLLILVSFVFLSCIYIIVIPVFLGKFSSYRTLITLGLAFVFTITSMASLSQYFYWFAEGSLKWQVVFFGSVFVIAWFLYNPKNKMILYLFIVLNFVVNGAFQLLSSDIGGDRQSLPISKNKLLSFVDERTPNSTPNIYLLVYDAYVSNETMLAYGIDNSPQEDYLSEQGFKLYPHTYSIGSTTIETMSRVFNASTEHYGSKRRGVSGDGIVHQIFKSIGYKTHGIFPTGYVFGGIGTTYDYTFPEPKPELREQYILLLRAILIGEFRFELDFTDRSREQFVETKQSILEGVSGKPVFIYAHSDKPSHSQNSGACLTNEAELYKAKLKMSNLEMKQDIKTITENDPGAIVIVAGDHGPYLTQNCAITTGFIDISEISRLDMQDRFGTFLAIRWPSQDFTKYDDITVLQDLFPSVFAYLLKDEKIEGLQIKPNTVFNSNSGATVNNGIIKGGINDGEPLFLSGK